MLEGLKVFTKFPVTPSDVARVKMIINVRSLIRPMRDTDKYLGLYFLFPEMSKNFYFISTQSVVYSFYFFNQNTKRLSFYNKKSVSL